MVTPPSSCLPELIATSLPHSNCNGFLLLLGCTWFLWLGKLFQQILTLWLLIIQITSQMFPSPPQKTSQATRRQVTALPNTKPLSQSPELLPFAFCSFFFFALLSLACKYHEAILCFTTVFAALSTFLSKWMRSKCRYSGSDIQLVKAGQGPTALKYSRKYQRKPDSSKDSSSCQ